MSAAANTCQRSPGWPRWRRRFLGIARKVGIGRKVVESCLRDLGLTVPKQGNVVSAARRRAVHAEVRRRYEAGESVLAMSDALGMTRRTIGVCLHELGLKPRTASEANVLRMARLSHRERRRLAAAANEKARTHAYAFKSSRYRAIQRQAGTSGVKVGKYERDIGEMLADAGIEAIPQWAIHVYNVDFFIPASRIAVEVYVSTARPVLSANTARKTMDLLCRGYCVLAVWFKSGGCGPVRETREQLVTQLNSLRPLPSGLGQYRVVRGYGDVDPVSPAYLDKFADVAVRYRSLQARGVARAPIRESTECPHPDGPRRARCPTAGGCHSARRGSPGPGGPRRCARRTPPPRRLAGARH